MLQKRRSSNRRIPEGIDIKPRLVLGSYVAFEQTGDNEAIFMGELVLIEDEYNRLISTLQQDGIEQTPVHKHLLGELPPIWWTHIYGRGGLLALAEHSARRSI